jgi:hypothetical protein
MTTVSGLIEWYTTPALIGNDAEAVLQNIANFFGDEEACASLFERQDDGRSVDVISPYLPYERHKCFAPPEERAWGWIDCYKDARGCVTDTATMVYCCSIYFRKK